MWHGSVAVAKKAAEWGGVRMDTDGRSAQYHKTQLNLSCKEFNILLLLVRSQGRYVDADVLEQAAWGDVSRTSPRLPMKIKTLRDKLAALGAPRDIIDTNRGIGYALRDC